MITDKEEFDINWTLPHEDKVLKKWLMWPGVLDWYPMSNEKEVDLIVRNWIGFAKYRSSLTAYYKGKPVGMATVLLMPYLKVAHLGMLYFIVDPEMQRKGIGRALLKNILHLAKTRFKLEKIHFDVYEGCPALALFEEFGFVKLLTQEHWIKDKGRYLTRILVEVTL